MKCLTVVNNKPPYPGITLAESRQMGMFGSFCFVGDGIDFQPPVYYHDLPDNYHRPYRPAVAVIDRAGIVSKPFNYPVITAPTAGDDETALVFLAEDMTCELGDIIGSVKTGDVQIIDETHRHYPWNEVMIVMPKGTKIVIKCQIENIGLAWDGTELKVTRE